MRKLLHKNLIEIDNKKCSAFNKIFRKENFLYFDKNIYYIRIIIS